MRRTMPLSRHNLIAACVSAAALAVFAAPAAAQTAATKSIGAAKGGKLLTRDELRACLAQQKDLAARKPQIEGERAALDSERAELVKIEESLKVDQAKLEKLARTANEVGQRTKDLQQRIADYNDRAAKFQNAGLSGPTAERQRRNLENEKAAIDKESAQLDADRAALADAEPLAKSFNARAETRNRATDEWNSRNQALAKKVQAYDADLANWQADCEGRSYREDDEKAILSGQ